MSEPHQQWSILDEETGAWWNCTAEEWSPLASVYDSYAVACCSGAFAILRCRRSHARIVPAPPREISDEETRAWFLAQGPDWNIRRGVNDSGAAWEVRGVVQGNVAAWRGPTIEDAIRKAAKTVALTSDTRNSK